MDEMVERVAKALFMSEHPKSQWSAGRARAKWFFMAEEAIRAMRVPSEAMGDQIIFADWCPSVPQGLELYVAMIDAALGDAA